MGRALKILVVLVALCELEVLAGPPAAPPPAAGPAPPQKFTTVLLTPPPLEKTAFDELTTTSDVCAKGELSSPATYLAEENIPLTFRWIVTTVVKDTLCSFEISPTEKYLFQTLQPYDAASKTNSNGVFPCGATANQVETKTFTLKASVCRECIVRFNWFTQNGVMRQCSKVILYNVKDKECIGKCRNGGVCKEGQCECTSRFEGQFCEKSKGKISH
eukprot:TRINITY_DN4240_c0_g1_i9.p1 TRINITY_DN4240_c0_g1~~TRINITY_DN4240_c0_g1_i9.p1  ORF type:complete len:217 (+),score=40.07 TRINITY_DN4240_c0_g1_i9:154-804(+)